MSAATATTAAVAGPVDLFEVRLAISKVLRSRTHDDGSFGPLMIRFAWHLSGTYDKTKNTGGSNGSTMRFDAEKNDPENGGLVKAMEVLEPVKLKFPWMSYADLWVLAGYVAIEVSGGPFIALGVGRTDFSAEEAEQVHGPTRCPHGDGHATNPNGSRLPAADLGSATDAPRGCPMAVKEKPTIDAMRGVFSRLGLTDKETVCLIVLGHQYGRCHLDISGYEQ
jgi:cytochrome c peroxidase